MSRSVADVDWSRLSPTARATLDEIALPVSEGEPLDEIAARLGIEREEVRRRLEELEIEATAIAGGPEPPAMTEDEFDALVHSIAELGQLVEILVDGAGRVIDGHHRMRACAKLRITPRTRRLTDERLTADERRCLALAVNVARRQLPAGARRGFIAAELMRDPQRSDRAVAATLGCSPTTVGRVRKELERQRLVSTVDTRTGRDGITQRAAGAARSHPQPPAEPARSIPASVVTCPSCGHSFDPIRGE